MAAYQRHKRSRHKQRYGGDCVVALPYRHVSAFLVAHSGALCGDLAAYSGINKRVSEATRSISAT